MRTMKEIATIVFLLWAGSSSVFAADYLKAFPAAEEGMTRHVIILSQQANEADFRVELIIGKTVKTDAANRYFFGGQLETESIPGWGFERHVLRQLGPMAGTLMAVDPAEPRVDRFITLGGEAKLLRYNSRLPLVVYVPHDVEVHHRIWRVQPVDRFVRKLALSGEQTIVVAEGDFEARSIGSYSVRLYSTGNTQVNDDAGIFASGLIRLRSGTLEKVFLENLGLDEAPSLIVTMRSVGTGSYVSADAFKIVGNKVVLHASITEMFADADPVVALKAVLKTSRKK
ncbi:Serine protease inhibitor ecotin [Nitrosospira sp. Nsp1]|nr:Serine protease inhibitor ecotin [Nitrosospira sp. Nsp1]